MMTKSMAVAVQPAIWSLLVLLGAAACRAEAPDPQYQAITPRVGVFRDVVNVGVIRGGGKVLLIDSGEGNIMDAARKLGFSSVDSVLYTHYHRDQCSGAARLRASGVRMAAPSAEARFFRNATDFWRTAENWLYLRFPNVHPAPFVLRESVVLDRELKNGDAFTWEGVNIRVLGTPGHTPGSLSYLVEADGKSIAFTGDLIYGPGQLWEFYSLQKAYPGMCGDYWGFGGAVPDLLNSLEKVVSQNPSVLVPSHGVIMTDPREAVRLLGERLKAVMRNFHQLTAWRVYGHMENPCFLKDVPPADQVPLLEPLPPKPLPAWMHRLVENPSASFPAWYIQAPDKSIFLLDSGATDKVLSALRRLTQEKTISGIDSIWITHYHFDHLVSINEVRRKYGDNVRVHVTKEMVDILENPTAYAMPAQVAESIRVDRPLADGEVLEWKGYRLTNYYFPGQTIYHGGLMIEHEGTKVFMTGDSFVNWGIDDYCPYDRNFIGKSGEVHGYERCLQLLLKLKPDILVASHWGSVPVEDGHLRRSLELLRERTPMFAKLFPWEDPNFGLDPYWIRSYPYRQSALPGREVNLEARVYNHSDSPRRTWVELRAPSGWKVKKAEPVLIPPHTEGKIPLSALAPASPGRQRDVLGLAVRFGDWNLGEAAEALVDFLDAR